MVYNMNEKPGDSFTRVVLKKGKRAKERILQNFGKADRTTDELFELYENNFNKQQNSAIRLQKEVKNYVTCIRSVQSASKGLMDCISDIYELEWPGHEQIPFKAQNLEALWEELCTKLNDQVTIPLSTYLSQFSEIKAKIDKRERKLVDYDSTRHALESVQNSNKKRDEMKLARLRDEMEGAKRLYDILNKELYDELPALFDSRIPFLISILQTLFATQSAFYGQNSRIQTQLNNYVDELALEAKKGTYHINARLMANNYNFNPHLEPLASTMIENSAIQNLNRSQQQLQNPSNYNLNNNDQVLLENTAAVMKFMASQANPNLQNTTGPHKIIVSDANSPIPSTASNLHNQVTTGHENIPADAIKVKSNSKENLENDNVNHNNSLNTQSNNAITNQNEHKQTNGFSEKTNHNDTNGLPKSPVTTSSSPIIHHINIEKESTASNCNETNTNLNKESQEQKIKSIYEIPPSATTKDLPPGVFYKVKATYKYDAEDQDELSFEAGEIIYVIEYEYPEEQEDGWLMGCKSSDGQKGLFPANFTIPV